MAGGQIMCLVQIGSPFPIRFHFSCVADIPAADSSLTASRRVAVDPTAALLVLHRTVGARFMILKMEQS